MSVPVTQNNSFDNILFAADLSTSSAAALSYAVGLARHFQSLLNIVNVVPAEICQDAQPPDPFYFRHSAENRMAHLVASEMFHGVRHREFVEEEQGNLPDVLSKLIWKLNIDLVILGSRGRGGMGKVLLGSISEEIANCAPCSILTVGPNVSSIPLGELTIRRILCATSLLPGSAKILAYALWLGEQEHAQVDFLHAIHSPSDFGTANSDIEKAKAMNQLKQLVALEAGHTVEIGVIVEIGKLAEQILKVAKRRSVDLIVMGPSSTSHPRIASHLPWVTPHQVLSQAHCPILTVRV